MDEIERLRRVPLTLGLIILTWGLAGVTIALPLKIEPLGLPLIVARPDLLPLGLALGAGYGALRYFYYGMMRSVSPYRRRRNVLNALQKVAETQKRTMFTYWGPAVMESRFNISGFNDARKWGAEAQKAFPTLLHWQPSFEVVEVVEKIVTDKGEGRGIYQRVRLTVPWSSRISALFEDIDYTAAVWFPFVSISVWALAR